MRTAGKPVVSATGVIIEPAKRIVVEEPVRDIIKSIVRDLVNFRDPTQAIRTIARGALFFYSIPLAVTEAALAQPTITTQGAYYLGKMAQYLV